MTEPQAVWMRVFADGERPDETVGDWVTAEDFDTLKAERDALAQRCEALEQALYHIALNSSGPASELAEKILGLPPAPREERK